MIRLALTRSKKASLLPPKSGCATLASFLKARSIILANSTLSFLIEDKGRFSLTNPKMA